MFCGNCGSKIDDNAGFCPNCGVKVSGNMQPAGDAQIQGEATSGMPETPAAAAYEPAVGQTQPVQSYQQEIPVQTTAPAQPVQPAAAKKSGKGMFIAIAIYSALSLLIGAFTEFESGMLTASIVGIVPSIILLVFVYRLDKMEKEPFKLLLKLFFGGGIISLILALLAEIVLAYGLNMIFGFAEEPEYGTIEMSTYIIYCLISNFICVALVEELSKYVVLKKVSWKNPAFDYRFDGVVYSVVTAIGFEIFENIEYIITSETGSLSTAIIRTSFPGHAIFGLYMGYFFGKAKALEHQGDIRGAKSLRIRGILVATAIHGLYDFLCSFGNLVFFIGVIPLVIILNLLAFRNVQKFQSEDTAF